MGHSTGSGRPQAGQQAQTEANSLDDVRSRAFDRLIDRGIQRRDAEEIADVNTMREAIRRFESVYDATRDSTPALTAERLVNELGERWANSVVATLVNSSEGDGRISGSNRRWASSVGAGAYSPGEARENRFSTSVHKAHLDQIADEMRRRQQRS